MKTAALLGGLSLGLATACSSFSFTVPASGEGGYCTKGWDGVPCQAGLVCNTNHICQQPVSEGGDCVGDVCAAGLVCVVAEGASTTGVCVPCAWFGTCSGS